MRRHAQFRFALPPTLLLAAMGCETFETGYFESKVGRATQQQVAARYGLPHKTDKPAPDREVWTYFDRGSNMGGYGRVQPCSEYHLTFDQDGILRAWELVSCRRQALTLPLHP